ncbi:cupin domain-containing protein [Chryseobacterium gambrini]|uniref:cupin domain-containing protein n=1 Tax=Chryseobacterium gambrini TaxID=373672 RepID=UPI003D0B0A8A
MIQSKDNSEHYIWGENCDSWILKNDGKLSVKQEIMPSGTSEKLHFHHFAEQFFYILKGKAVLFIDDEKLSVKGGESITITPKSKHYIANESDEDLEFLVISSPSTDNDRTEV